MIRTLMWNFFISSSWGDNLWALAGVPTERKRNSDVLEKDSRHFHQCSYFLETIVIITFLGGKFHDILVSNKDKKIVNIWSTSLP